MHFTTCFGPFCLLEDNYVVQACLSLSPTRVRTVVYVVLVVVSPPLRCYVLNQGDSDTTDPQRTRTQSIVISWARVGGGVRKKEIQCATSSHQSQHQRTKRQQQWPPPPSSSPPNLPIPLKQSKSLSLSLRIADALQASVLLLLLSCHAQPL